MTGWGDFHVHWWPKVHVTLAMTGLNVPLHTGENRDNGLLHFAGDPRVVLFNVNVDLTPHAEFGQVDSRLNRKASARDDLAVVTCLEIIHIRPIAVDVFADGVARAVDEVLSVTMGSDDPARRVVHHVAVNRLALLYGLFHEIHSRITCLSHNIEDLCAAVRHQVLYEPRPGNIEIHRSRPAALAPHVEENEVPLVDCLRSRRRGRVVG